MSLKISVATLLCLERIAWCLAFSGMADWLSLRPTLKSWRIGSSLNSWLLRLTCLLFCRDFISSPNCCLWLNWIISDSAVTRSSKVSGFFSVVVLYFYICLSNFDLCFSGSFSVWLIVIENSFLSSFNCRKFSFSFRIQATDLFSLCQSE